MTRDFNSNIVVAVSSGLLGCALSLYSTSYFQWLIIGFVTWPSAKRATLTGRSSRGINLRGDAYLVGALGSFSRWKPIAKKGKIAIPFSSTRGGIRDSSPARIVRRVIDGIRENVYLLQTFIDLSEDRCCAELIKGEAISNKRDVVRGRQTL